MSFRNLTSLSQYLFSIFSSLLSTSQQTFLSYYIQGRLFGRSHRYTVQAIYQRRDIKVNEFLITILSYMWMCECLFLHMYCVQRISNRRQKWKLAFICRREVFLVRHLYAAELETFQHITKDIWTQQHTHLSNIGLCDVKS